MYIYIRARVQGHGRAARTHACMFACSRNMQQVCVRARTQMPLPQSEYPGVTWFAKKRKWVGYVRDRSVRVGKMPKNIHVGYFACERACVDAACERDFKGAADETRERETDGYVAGEN